MKLDKVTTRKSTLRKRRTRTRLILELLWLQGYGFRDACERMGIRFLDEAAWRPLLLVWTKIRKDNMKMGARRQAWGLD